MHAWLVFDALLGNEQAGDTLLARPISWVIGQTIRIAFKSSGGFHLLNIPNGLLPIFRLDKITLLRPAGT